ncbi:MAG: YitT family protein [Burkholderiaceae bacterium]
MNIAPWKSWLPLIVLVWVVLGWLQIVAAHTGGGREFFNGLLKTFVAVALLSVWAQWVPQWIVIGALDRRFAAVAAGLFTGTGMLMLFRHRASLGGFNVLVLYLQERFGWRAGKVQMGMDCAIVVAAFSLVDVSRIGWSVVGAVVLNLTLAINHRPGRYMAV